MSLGLIEAPGKLGADIVVGDASRSAFRQPSAGRPAASSPSPRNGCAACQAASSGQTVDRDGKRGFVLTLQAREQHIRREKATSNICSNQALLALCASVYLSTMGKQGIQDVATLNLQKAHYAAAPLRRVTQTMQLAFAAPFFNEFVVKCNKGIELEGAE